MNKELIQSAAERGILPEHATHEDTTRPWPIVLMTGLGAWLAAIPFIAVIFMIGGDVLTWGPMSYLMGGLFLAGALFILRGDGRSEFVEQLALPALLVGGVLLGMGLYRDTQPLIAGALLTLIALGVAWRITQNWLRVLLGAVACSTFIAMVANNTKFDEMQLWGGIHCALLVWLVATTLSDKQPVSATNAGNLIALESASGGWIALVLFGLAAISGKTFMLGAQWNHMGSRGLASTLVGAPLPQTVSLIMAIAGAAWLAHSWTVLRTPRLLLVAALLAALSWLIPMLGGALLVLAVCVASSRWIPAATAAVAAAWIFGSFYYQLNVSLSSKAAIMTCMGAAFGLIAWLNWRRQSRRDATPVHASRWRQTGIAVSLAATLIVANGAIWQKENLIANGRPVFMELAPADPRSLMQGDYMALRFHMPVLDKAELSAARRIKVVAKIDARSVAIMQGIDSGKPLEPDEILIELLHTGGGLRPATDAWHFKEGEADRWAKARFGEFRIDGQGRALLVGLRGANLEKL